VFLRYIWYWDGSLGRVGTKYLQFTKQSYKSEQSALNNVRTSQTTIKRE